VNRKDENMDLDGIKTLYESYLFNNYGREDICLSHGEREFLYDVNGKRYVDYVAGIAVNCLGHAHPALVRAVSEQAKRMLHVSNLYYTMEQADLGEAIASIVPSPLAVSMFCNSGTEANEAALKLSAKHTRRSNFVACTNSFHGRTAGALSATGQRKYQEGYECLLSNAFDFVEYNDCEAIKDAITKETAAMVVEMVQGEAGIIPANTEFVRTIRDLCDETGALMVVDEVQTGVGRTGKWFGFQHYGVVPDIISLAKGLGGGVPIGAIVSTREVAKTFTPGTHGTTFGGNPLACAAGKAVINTIKKDGLVERSADLGGQWKRSIQQIADECGGVKEVRGIGLMIGIEIGPKAKEFKEHCFEKGMLVNVAGGNTIRLVPPLIIGEDSARLFDRTLAQYL
jgi:acetylornithine aminotransferase/acetylornithine/N-succinyldiaminopimelate aminotransferase